MTAIKGLSIQAQALFGYIRANRFAGEAKLADGNYWRNSYGFIQLESNLVYETRHWRFFTGVGWACHNDGKDMPAGIQSDSDNFLWVGGGVGYLW